MRCVFLGPAPWLFDEGQRADELVNAIRKVMSGGDMSASSWPSGWPLSIGSDTSKLPHETLSDREFQVLRLMATGKPAQRCRGTQSQSQNRQHLPGTYVGKDESGDHRGVDSLRS